MTLCWDCWARDGEQVEATREWDEGPDWWSGPTREPRHKPLCQKCYAKRDNYEPGDRGFEDAMAAKYPIEN